MRLWAYLQDNTIPGCGDSQCCGEPFEELDWSFHLSAEPMSEEQLRDLHGGGPLLKVRKAKKKEIRGYWVGFDHGMEDGWKQANHLFQENKEAEIQENLHERTNNSRNGDAEILDLDKSARTDEYIDGLRDAFEFTMKRISAISETFDNMQEIARVKKGMTLNNDENYITEIAVFTVLAEQIEGDYFDKLDEVRRGRS